ncbi:uncharacterized protein LOC107362026 [Tetranychus urticae]|uniref:F-box domain-containing protein n=1 Tax=Tetranychus urticae TaxID=32264 RepID=T1K909_TETUR|nr:uncharacterized protein LOC107362026 [Tetranychus urticae]
MTETKTFFDLPDTIQLKILSYITNIREKIRLASVSSQFYHLVSEACRTQNYKLVNLSDFMYAGEIEKGAENHGTVFVNLHTLLRFAPRLTHFVDKIYHFDYEAHVDSDNKKIREPLPLPHIKYLAIDLCQFYFFGKPYEPSFEQKLSIFFADISSVLTLDIRIDRDYKINFPNFHNLKALRLAYYANDRWPRLVPVPPSMLRIVSGRLPCLEEFELTSHYIDIYNNLPGMMTDFAISSPNLRSIKVTQHSTYHHDFPDDMLPEYHVVPYTENQKLFHLEYLDLRGAVFPLSFWEKLLMLVPNLKYLVCNPSTNKNITRLAARFCRQAKYNIERPFEIEDEYRHYTQRTHGFNNQRYLYSIEN